MIAFFILVAVITAFVITGCAIYWDDRHPR